MSSTFYLPQHSNSVWGLGSRTWRSSPALRPPPRSPLPTPNARPTPSPMPKGPPPSPWEIRVSITTELTCATEHASVYDEEKNVGGLPSRALKEAISSTDHWHQHGECGQLPKGINSVLVETGCVPNLEGFVDINTESANSMDQSPTNSPVSSQDAHQTQCVHRVRRE